VQSTVPCTEAATTSRVRQAGTGQGRGEYSRSKLALNAEFYRRTPGAIACEGSSACDWPARNFFGAALCSAFSLERKARVGWWGVAFSAWDDSARALAPRYLCFPRPTTRKLSRLPPSLPPRTHTTLLPPAYSPPHHHHITSATMVHTNGNAAHGETFLYVPPRQHHHHHGPVGW